MTASGEVEFSVLPPSATYTVIRVKENALIPADFSDRRVQAISSTQKPIVIPCKLSKAEKTKVGATVHKWLVCRQMLIKAAFATRVKVSGSRAYQKGLTPFVEWLRKLYELAKETHALQSFSDVPLVNPQTQQTYSDAGTLFALILNELEECDLYDVLAPVTQPSGRTTKRKTPLPAGKKEAAISQLRVTRDALRHSARKPRDVDQVADPCLKPHLFALLSTADDLFDIYKDVGEAWKRMARAYALWVRDIERGNWVVVEEHGDEVMLRGRKQTGFDNGGKAKYTSITKRL